MNKLKPLNKARRFAIFIPIAAILLILDRVTKIWAATELTAQAKQAFIPNLVSLVYVENTGAAFGVFKDGTVIFSALAILFALAVVAVLIFVKRISTLDIVAISLIFTGAVGNLIDRLQTGYVVDFLNFEFIDFPVFNVADACITIGAIACILALLFFDEGAIFKRDRA